MGIDRERKPPHPGFFRKEKAPKAVQSLRKPSASAKSNRRPDNFRVPAEGPIKVFFDDVREMPEGFVVARTVPALRTLLESIDLSRLHTVCLDWHLEFDAQTVGGESGHDAVKIIVEMIEADHERFSGLSSIWLHSTNLDEAIAMARTLERCIHSKERREFFDDVYILPDTYSPRSGI